MDYSVFGIVLENLAGTSLTKPEKAMVRRAWLLRHLDTQNHRCAYCRRPIDPDVAFSDDLRATIDHIVSLGIGGEDSYQNTLAACHGCNSHKGHGTFRELEVTPWFRRVLGTQ